MYALRCSQLYKTMFDDITILYMIFNPKEGVNLRIQVEHHQGGENEVILRCEKLDEEMLEILAFLKDRSTKIAASKEGEIFVFSPDEIYYAEAVDARTFLYTKDHVYDSQLSLAELELRYGDMGMLRIAKSQVVNFRHIKKLKSLPDRRIILTLASGEKMIVSRHYKQALVEKLGIK